MPSQVEKPRFDISLEDLQTFIAVANLGGIGRAARHLNLSQPSVSNRIRRLEDKLKVKLMDRAARGIILTEHGEQLQEQAVEVLVGLNDLLQRFHVTGAEVRRPVKLAVATPMVQMKLPWVLNSFQKAQPNTVVHVYEQLFDETVDTLVSGKCELALMTCEALPDILDFETVILDDSAIVVSRTHPLAKSGKVSLADALEYPVLLPKTLYPPLNPIYKAVASRGLFMRLAPEAEGVRHPLTLMAMAAAGLGIVIFPKSFVPPEFSGVISVLDISDCDIPRHLGLTWIRSRRLSPQAEAFRAFVMGTRSPDLRNWPDQDRTSDPA